VGSDPAGSIGVLWVLCVVRLRSLRRVDHSSREFLPNVVCLSVIGRRIKGRSWPGIGSKLHRNQYSLVEGYHCFGGICRLHLQSKIEPVTISDSVVTLYLMPLRFDSLESCQKQCPVSKVKRGSKQTVKRCNPQAASPDCDKGCSPTKDSHNCSARSKYIQCSQLCKFVF
jgi:hypothetical protein